MANRREYDEQKYNGMEEILQNINRCFISLPNDETRRNNAILSEVLENLIQNMRVDSLFQYLYRDKYYGGSYYDALKISKPDEYDLDLLFDLPDYAQPTVRKSDVSGFVYVHLKDTSFLEIDEPKIYSYMKSQLLDENHYLVTTKASAWMGSVIRGALDELPEYMDVGWGDLVHVTAQKAGPAYTLKINDTMDETLFKVDIVPCFVFDEDDWPKRPYRKNPIDCRSEFFVVPKKPYNRKYPETYWRLSFQQQESALMYNRNNLKPVLRLLKKFRDTQRHNTIASYYIKTIFLWENQKNINLWSKSLSYVFMAMLKKYQEYLEKGKIPDFWNKKNNLIGGLHPDTPTNMANYLHYTIQDIEKNPEKVAEYLLSQEELYQLEFYMAQQNQYNSLSKLMEQCSLLR